MKNTIRITLFSLLVLAIAPSRAGDIAIEDAWIPEAPPTAKVLACYLTIENHSKSTVMLESVTSDDFGAVEIHASEMHDGMMHMRKEDHLHIDADSSLKLEPGGYHLMLMDKKRTLKAGDHVDIELRFSNDESMHIEAEVRK
ncbi:MAG: copper chaperone PCu(A)C [Hahellaceae bacterium]|nr:copper chaperone PCu(A)C [Hahellaceae bacterium]